jgi:hypothetical protein
MYETALNDDIRIDRSYGPNYAQIAVYGQGYGLYASARKLFQDSEGLGIIFSSAVVASDDISAFIIHNHHQAILVPEVCSV